MKESTYPVIRTEDIKQDDDKYFIQLPESAKEHFKDSESYVFHCVYADYADWNGIELISPHGYESKVVPITELYDRIKLTENSILSFDCYHPLFLYDSASNRLTRCGEITILESCLLPEKDSTDPHFDEYKNPPNWDDGEGEYILIL